jgi:putative hydrolase of HD superfamily
MKGCEMPEMESKAENPVSLIAGMDIHPLIEAYFEFNHLKQLYRQGWLKKGVPAERCESIAEHSFSTTVLVYFLAQAYFPDLDPNRVILLALLHDFGEVYAGDLTPDDHISFEKKEHLEREAINRIFSKLPNADEFLGLWEEYERQSSPEAGFIRQIDRLEMALQASVYERQGFNGLDDFFNSARQAISDPLVVALLEELSAMR